VEERMQLLGKQRGMKREKFSVCLVGQERKHHGGIGVETWNGQCLGPRRGGLESLI